MLPIFSQIFPGQTTPTNSNPMDGASGKGNDRPCFLVKTWRLAASSVGATRKFHGLGCLVRNFHWTRLMTRWYTRNGWKLLTKTGVFHLGESRWSKTIQISCKTYLDMLGEMFSFFFPLQPFWNLWRRKWNCKPWSLGPLKSQTLII